MVTSKTYHSRYIPHHPEKYLGDPTNIICRSSWERKFAKWCDDTTAVKHWQSEEFFVPYVSPVDGRIHRYFADFRIDIQSPNAPLRTYVIEVKPQKQTQPPTTPARRTKRFITEAATYAINQAKWAACQEYCRERGWTFMVLTEQHLFRNFRG